MNKITRLLSVGVLSTFLLVSQAGVASAAQKYSVKKGDSLYLIGKKFKVTVKQIQQTNKLKTINLSIGQVLFIPTAQGTPAAKPTPSRGSSDSRVGMLLEWSAADKLFPVDSKVKVTDLVTGLTFWVSRLYGHNHADVEPLTVNDTETMKKAWGGYWSWDRRPVLVELNGRLVAASMNGMPHGQEKIHNNGMDGQVCMHFLNSRTHAGNRLDIKHQLAVKKAAGLE